MKNLTVVQIIDFQPEHAKIFKDLNQRWIEEYFKMEREDYKSLDYPLENIINKGGHILMATNNELIVGTCALIKMEEGHYDYELAKMAVSPEAQGLGIGHLLGMATLDRAKSLGAKNVYLESNTILSPAINLYRKLGFQEVKDHVSPYSRCNIQMVYKII